MTWFALFVYSALAATVLPGGSEVLFSTLLYSQPQDALWLWVVATLGNSLGAVFTLYMGWVIKYWQTQSQARSSWRLILEKRFSISVSSLGRMQRFGHWLLLLSWVPIIGDGFCLAAGYLGWRRNISICLIVIGKAGRYGVLWYLLV